MRSTIRLCVICFLAFILRLFLLDAQSLWWDEAISLHLATSTVAELLADRVAHVHPPLYFLLIKGWVSVAGTSAFSVRFLSAWFNTLLVPVVYAFSYRWVGRFTGLLASTLVAFSPLYVVYSQEARVYALLPLVYLAILALVNRITRPESPVARHHWFLLTGVEVVGLHLHYVVLLIIAYANLLLLLRLWRRQRKLTRWLASLALVALLCLPWAIAVISNLEAVRADSGVDDPFTEPLPLGFFVRLLWAFQWSGLTAAPRYAPLYLSTLAVAILLLAALVLLFVDTLTRVTTLHLLAHWGMPLIPALLMWQAKPLSHPRYIALFAAALLLLVGYSLAQLSHRRAVGRVLAILLSLAVLTASSLALHAWYAIPSFAKDDVRGLASRLEIQTTADDLVIAPWQDWSLDYAYRGPAPIFRPNPLDEPTVWHQLATQSTVARRVFLIDYYRAPRNQRSLIPFALESAGSLSNLWHFKGLYVREYQIDRPVATPDLSPVSARFGPVQLSGAWIEPGPPADTAVPVALQWHLEKPVSSRLRAGLRLRDSAGWTWSTADDWLLNEAAAPTDRWGVAHAATTYHLLPLPLGTPPLSYTLTVGVYLVEEGGIHPLDLLDTAGAPYGQTLDLGSVSLSPPLGLKSDPYRLGDQVVRWEIPVVVGNGLTLAGAALDRTSAAPGQPVYVSLRWIGALPALSTQTALLLEQGGETLLSATAPAGGRYPAEHWAAGQTVIEHRRLTIPPTADDGPVYVSLQIGAQQVELGSVNVTAGEHLLEPPPMAHELGIRFGDVAELAGYDLESEDVKGAASREITVATDETTTITLYWKALAGASSVDYTVFTHILAPDGHLVGQHDGPPAEGARPTLGWISGEFIVDRHAMTFREAYTGPARIAVGLYDPITMERVPIAGGGTFVLLPTIVNVQAHQD